MKLDRIKLADASALSTEVDIGQLRLTLRWKYSQNMNGFNGKLGINHKKYFFRRPKSLVNISTAK